MTVAALRQLLAEIDTQGGPDAARDNRLALPPPERSISFTAVRAWARQTGIPSPPPARPPRKPHPAPPHPPTARTPER